MAISRNACSLVALPDFPEFAQAVRYGVPGTPTSPSLSRIHVIVASQSGRLGLRTTRLTPAASAAARSAVRLDAVVERNLTVDLPGAGHLPVPAAPFPCLPCDVGRGDCAD